jgi:hypothetical protein
LNNSNVYPEALELIHLLRNFRITAIYRHFNLDLTSQRLLKTLRSQVKILEAVDGGDQEIQKQVNQVRASGYTCELLLQNLQRRLSGTNQGVPIQSVKIDCARIR